MFINPATHYLRFTGTSDNVSVGEFLVQYLVMDGLDVVRKDSAAFMVVPGSNANMNPTLEAGQSWQVQAIYFLSGGNGGFSVTRRALDGNVDGFLIGGGFLINERYIFADHRLTRYDVNGVPYASVQYVFDGGGA